MATEATREGKHTFASETPRGSVWLAGAVTLGWAFALLHTLVVRDYAKCRILGAPSKAEGVLGALVLVGMLTLCVVGALRWSGRKAANWPTGLLWSCAVGAAGVAGGVAAFFLFLTPYPGAVEALAFGLAWAGVGAIPARACLTMTATTRRQSIKRMTCAVVSALPALGVGYYLLTHVVPVPCVKYAYERVYILAPSLVGCVMGCYGVVTVAGRRSASRMMTPERELQTGAD